MKQNSRKRSRGSRNMRANIYDSNGPDVRIRGTANQVFDKYCSLAKDALSAGDKIVAENYLQHAEHYQRLMDAQIQIQERQQNNQTASSGNHSNHVHQNKDDITASDETESKKDMVSHNSRGNQELREAATV